MTNIELFSVMDRLEALRPMVQTLPQYDELYNKISEISLFLNRFQDVPQLIEHLKKVEEAAYALKKFLSIEEAARYLGISTGYMYRLTARNKIPFFQPGGKMIFIYIEDLNRYIKSNRIISEEEMEQKERDYKMELGSLVDIQRRKLARK